MRPTDLARALKAEVEATGCLVGISGGKDSAVVIDLLCRLDITVRPYFMYVVPGLEFQEQYLDAVERRYGVTIIRRPHWCLSPILRNSGYRPSTTVSTNCPVVSATRNEAALRHSTKLEWIATGERVGDSLHRCAMLKSCGGMDHKRRRCYPIAYWTIEMVRHYIALHRLPLAPESRIIGRSFGDFRPDMLRAIRDHYPADFALIKKRFPHVEASIVREEFFGQGGKQDRNLRHGADPSLADHSGALQPAQD